MGALLSNSGQHHHRAFPPVAYISQQPAAITVIIPYVFLRSTTQRCEDVLKKCITYRTGFPLLSQHVNPCYLFQDKAAFIALQIHNKQPQLQLLHV